MTILPQRTRTEVAPERFARVDFVAGAGRCILVGRWANANVYLFEHCGKTWVVKDFFPRRWLVRNLIGRFLTRREVSGLRRLAGLPGVPQGAFRVDAFALAYHYVPGRRLRGLRASALPADFFPALERNLRSMHARAAIAHFDLRNAANIVVSDTGSPSLIDFQSHVSTRWLPLPLRRFAEHVDRAAIYKHWALQSPSTLGSERRAILDRINRLRPLWVLRGYFGRPRDGYRDQ